MKIYTFDKSRYYSADEVYEKNPAFFYGCKNNPRNIVDKKGIDEKEYLYAYQKNNEWVEKVSIAYFFKPLWETAPFPKEGNVK